jgi:hypothetical protein
MIDMSCSDETALADVMEFDVFLSFVGFLEKFGFGELLGHIELSNLVETIEARYMDSPWNSPEASGRCANPAHLSRQGTADSA